MSERAVCPNEGGSRSTVLSADGNVCQKCLEHCCMYVVIESMDCSQILFMESYGT